jgi:ferric-dicitrate binding protein FerR (iron transport regulator)
MPLAAAAALLAGLGIWHGWVVPRRPAAWVERPGTPGRMAVRAGVAALDVPPGERWGIALRGGTSIEAHPGALLRILEADGSAVALDRGRALFEVVPGTPFSVRAPGGVVEVRGTRFAVTVPPLGAAPAGLPAGISSVHVERGAVRVASDAGEALLRAGQRSVLAAGIPPPVVDGEQARAWLDGWRGEAEAARREGRLPSRDVLLNLLALEAYDMLEPGQADRADPGRSDDR